MPGYKIIYNKVVESKMLCIMKENKDSITYRRAQALYLRSRRFTPKEISKIIGISVGGINNIHSKFNQYGESSVFCKKSGGRNNANMSKEDEALFMNNHESKSLLGSICTISSIHQDLEKHLKKTLHKSGVYKMLKRNGWRKIMPRPENPNHDQEAIDAFKKTSPHWLKEQT
jgi:transposase